MKCRVCIIISYAFGLWFLSFGFFSVSAQKLAIIAPEKSSVTEKLLPELSDKLKALDSDLVKTAFRAAAYENIFNLTNSEAKTIGEALGCDFFVLLKAETQRRNSSLKGDYFESYAVVYLVSSKTGHLIFWKIYIFEDETDKFSGQKLFDGINLMTADIKDKLKDEIIEKLNIAEFTEDDKLLRSPLPYKRIKPAYTVLANLYSIAATVDIEIDLNEKGEITRTEILRWAGFGLEESVVETVKKMNWRPALKDGKPLPIRVLLRYNFKKIEKDD